MAFKRALVVDDSRSARVALKKLLDENQLDVEFAESGEEALAFLDREMVDVVFMDHHMPGMDGEETLAALRALDPGVQVVLTSGYTQLEVSQRFEHHPGLRFIQKPYTYGALLRILRDALGSDFVEE